MKRSITKASAKAKLHVQRVFLSVHRGSTAPLHKRGSDFSLDFLQRPPPRYRTVRLSRSGGTKKTEEKKKKRPYYCLLAGFYRVRAWIGADSWLARRHHPPNKIPRANGPPFQRSLKNCSRMGHLALPLLSKYWVNARRERLLKPL